MLADACDVVRDGTVANGDGATSAWLMGHGSGAIGPATGVRVYLACGATEMRKGMPGLSTMKVIQIPRVKKSCRRCERMVQPAAPTLPIPGSVAGPGLLAHVLISKFDDHVPLYRLNEIYARMDADVPDSTLLDWCGRAMKVLEPIIDRIEAEVRQKAIIPAHQ